MATRSYYAPKGGLPPQTDLLTGRAVFTTSYAVIPRGVMSDIVTSYLPFWEKTRKLGIKNLCVHKGLPLGFFDAQIRCGDSLLGVFDLKTLEKGILLPWPQDPQASWIYFDCDIECFLDSGIVVHNRLPQVNNAPSLRTAPVALLPELTCVQELVPICTGDE